MKKALVQGTRIIQIVNDGDEFPVHPDLSWVIVANDTTGIDTYEGGEVLKYNPNPPSSTLEEASLRARQRLSESFQYHRNRGTEVTIDDVKVSLATTHTAQQELRELVLQLANGKIQKGVTRSGKPIVFTEAISRQCLEAINKHQQACNNSEYSHLVTLSAFSKIADIDEYDVTTGWPSVT